MADPITEQWTEAFITLLDTIKTSSGYSMTVKPTTREYKEVTSLTTEEMPLIQLGLQSLIQNYDVWPLVEVSLSQELAFSVENNSVASTELQKLKADIEKCIRSNKDLNGLCQNMRMTQADLNAKVTTGDSLEGRAVIETTLWHRESDPTQGR